MMSLGKCGSFCFKKVKARLAMPRENRAVVLDHTQSLQALVNAANFLRPSNCLSLPEPAPADESTETQMLDSLAQLCARSDDYTVALVAEHRIHEMGTRSLNLLMATNDPGHIQIMRFLQALMATMRSVSSGSTDAGLHEIRICALQHIFERIMSRLMLQYGDFLTMFDLIERRFVRFRSRFNDPLLVALKSISVFKDVWQRDEPLHVSFWQCPSNARRLWHAIDNMRIKIINALDGIERGHYYGQYEDSHRFDLESYLRRLLDIPQHIHSLCRQAEHSSPSLKDFLVNPARVTIVPRDRASSEKRGKPHRPCEWLEIIEKSLHASNSRDPKVIVEDFVKRDCKRMSKDMARRQPPLDAECNMVMYLLKELSAGPGQCNNYMALSKRPSRMTMLWIHAFNTCAPSCYLQESHTPIKLAFNCTRFVPCGGSIGGKEPLWTVPQLGGDMQEGVVGMMRQILCNSFKASYPGFQDVYEALDALIARLAQRWRL